MSRINGRRKGASFERAIAKDLRAFLDIDRTGLLWSVMRAQTDRQRGQDPKHAGEFVVECISDPGKRFPWAIECKASQAWSEAQLWSVPVAGPITSTAKRRGYWQQAVEQASAVGLAPLLVVKRKNGPTLAIAERKTFAPLHLPNPRLRFTLEVHGQRWDLEAVSWGAVMACPASALETRT